VKPIEGVAIGLVSEVDAKLGRVKVSFPWMDPPQTSHWAPIASLLSGKKRGARFMPELSDEALVAFDRGQFDHPYVVGFLWNGEDEAPDNVKTNRVVVTPGGHELRFEDKDGDRRIVLKTADGHALTLDDKAKSITLESKRGHKLEILDQTGKVTLATKSGGKITLDDVPGAVTVEASQNRVVLNPSGISIQAGAGTLNITASGVTNITAQGAMNVNAAAAVNLLSSAAVNVTAGAAVTIQAGAATSIISAGPVSVTSGMVTVNAPMTTFTGVVQAQTVIATSIVASTYTPGVGNIW
jgi:hypothetical protein